MTKHANMPEFVSLEPKEKYDVFLKEKMRIFEVKARKYFKDYKDNFLSASIDSDDLIQELMIKMLRYLGLMMLLQLTLLML